MWILSPFFIVEEKLHIWQVNLFSSIWTALCIFRENFLPVENSHIVHVNLFSLAWLPMGICIVLFNVAVYSDRVWFFSLWLMLWFFKVWLFFNTIPHWAHLGWRRRWVLRSKSLLNFLLHFVQLWYFLPWAEKMCFSKYCAWVNVLLHWEHGHWTSVMCFWTCVFKFTAWKYDILQRLHMCGLIPPCMNVCVFSAFFELNDLLHWTQACSFSALWLLMWLFKESDLS